MRSMRQPTRFTLEKATDLGQLMAMTEPGLTPDLRKAHEYASYVEFLQAHRHRLEQERVFNAWDARLNTLIEAEGKMLGFVLTDRDDWDELHIAIATPIRCAFWYGWETVHNIKAKYDQHVREARAQDSQVQVLQVRNAPDAPKVTRKDLVEQSDAFWDDIATSMVTSANTPAQPTPPAKRP